MGRKDILVGTQVGFYGCSSSAIASILRIDVPVTLKNGRVDPTQKVNVYLNVAPSAHLSAALDLTVPNSGGSPTPGMTGPQGTVTPIPSMPTIDTAVAEFVTHESPPFALGVVDN